MVLGAVQLGALAACFVLFVPMGMAGWHLSRNKVLFFSGALFITLAVGVHLTPYFPSVAHFIASLSFPLSPSSSYSPAAGRTQCLRFLHNVVWDRAPGRRPAAAGNASSSITWDWVRSGQAAAAVSTCGFQKLGKHDVSDLLNGSCVLIAGDSQARLFALALLRLLIDDPADMEAVEGDLFKRHSDYHIAIPKHGLKLDYVWAPYETNLTGVMGRLRAQRAYPDVLVMGSGLWHMLHVSNASDYSSLLGLIRRSAASLVPISPELLVDDGPLPSAATATGHASLQPPHMFWLGMPTLVHSLLKTEEKKQKMGRLIWDAYNRDFSNSNLLRASGGHFLLLDIASLSRSCGLGCTSDGMHYDDVVYEAAMQIMLNALLIESHQRV